MNHPQKQRRFVLLIIACSLAATPFLQAAKNPLDSTPADHFAAISPGIKIEDCSEGGKSLASLSDDASLEYEAMDFDSGVAGFKARIATPRPGTIEIHLDRPDGPLMGKLIFDPTGGWKTWQDVSCAVDNSQSGVRKVFLVVHGAKGSSLVNISRFTFLKSIPITGPGTDLSSRLDKEDDELQSTNSWGIPENGFTDDFKNGLTNWISEGITAIPSQGAVHHGEAPGFAYTPNAHINKTDTGGEWRTMAEASLSADIVIDSDTARPGIGFTSKDGKQWVYVVLNPAENTIEARRRLLDGSDTLIHRHPKSPDDPQAKNYPAALFKLEKGATYRLKVAWSPYSDALIAFLYDSKGAEITNFRTVIDLPVARFPMILCSKGDAHFGQVIFDPNLDGWNFRWEWRKTPILSSDVCNPTVWKGGDGRFYMMWRKFGQDTWHGIASSSDAVHWDRVNDNVVKCTGDMNIVMNPNGDGKNYISGGGGDADWYTTAETTGYTNWTKSGEKVGTIYGNCRIQEIIDTARQPQFSPVNWNGTNYRYIAYTEDWNREPKPHSVVLLANTLTNWVQSETNPVIPPNSAMWGEKGNAIGSAFPLPDGNILISSCSCTFDGYTGASEPSNISAIADGKQPWKILKLAILPDAPVSREKVWYQGPNFGTAFLYDKESDTLYFYGGFHDYNIGMMRVRNFSRSRHFLDGRRREVKVETSMISGG